MKQTDINRKLPLWVYLSLAFLIFSVVLIIIMWLFQTVFFDSFYRLIKTNQTQNCSDSVVRSIDEDSFTSVIRDIEQQNNMSVSVYDTTNEIFTAIYTPDRMLHMSNAINLSSVYRYYNEAKANGGSANITSDYNDIKIDLFRSNQIKNTPFMGVPALEQQSSRMLTHVTITNACSREYFVIVEANIAPVVSTVETLRYQLIIMTVIILIISVVISIITARYLSKPISQTNETAKQLAIQNYNINFSNGVYRELCELNDTLTYSAVELQKVDNLRRELIANISHDLRTPLTMINGYAEVMRDLPGEITPENLQIIIDETNRLSMLVNDLLDISKLESDTVTLHKEIFNLTATVKEILTRYTKLTEQDGYTIQLDCERDVYINADRLRITQVVYNLINNAINYSGDDKTVIIKQTVSQGKVKIEVTDHGNGIEPEKLQYIWDRYYKVDKEHRQSTVSTGLGLSIVKNILTLHNATFGVDSVLGRGSCFWFELEISKI